VILEAAKEFKSPKDAKNAYHWWDDECKKAIQEKHEARGKCLIRKKGTWIYTIKKEHKLTESAGERKKNG
jgi:hypothetical protein